MPDPKDFRDQDFRDVGGQISKTLKDFSARFQALGPDPKDVRDIGARPQETLETLGPDPKDFGDLGARYPKTLKTWGHISKTLFIFWGGRS